MKRIVESVSVVVLIAVAAVLGAFTPHAYAQQQPRAAKVVCDGSTTVGPLAKAFAEYYMSKHPEVNVTVSESGSGNGAKNLINGDCDVADMSRFMNDSEFKAAVDKGILPVAHVVAMDGIAVIVHPANPARNLSLAQVKDIYTGKVTNWSQVGGPNLPIVVISRDTNSGTYESFEAMVMKGERIAASAEYVGSSGSVRDRVQTTQTAAGYVGLGFVDRTVKAVTVNGIAADRRTVATGKYPVSRPLFMFTNKYPELGSPLHEFVTLYLTRDGQKIVEGTGFVPVTDYPEAQ